MHGREAENAPPQSDVAEKPSSDVADRMLKLARGGAVELIAIAIRAADRLTAMTRGARELVSALMRDARARERSKTDDPVR